MSRVPFVRQLAVSGIALGALLIPAAGWAADLDYYEPRYSARPYPEPVPQYEPRVYGPPRVYAPRAYDPPPRRRVVYDADGCRVIFKRRVDDYGREVTHRIRDCDERAARERQAWAEPRYRYDEPTYAPRVYERPAYDYRPPRPVGPYVDDDID